MMTTDGLRKLYTRCCARSACTSRCKRPVEADGELARESLPKGRDTPSPLGG